MSRQDGLSFSGSTCYFVGFAVHRLIYSCGVCGTQVLPRA